jgi:5-methylcytosine-specific restriction enzyme subunit McrC
LKNQNHITVFEHQLVRFDDASPVITETQFRVLEQYYGNGRQCPYFTLVRNGVRFNEHVGVLQFENLLIEVLPKADRLHAGNEEQTTWRGILIEMLRKVKSLEIKSSSASDLSIKPNSILDLYFEMFVAELEFILHRGLIKRYRNKEENCSALQGQLLFAKQIQHNLVHKQRFHVSHTIYDYEHELHKILYKALRLVNRICNNNALKGKIGSLLLNFPEMSDIHVTEATFEKIAYTRKNENYRKVLNIAKIILLNYHPNVSTGRHNVLALMFDMNKLWEKFIYVTLKSDEFLDVHEQVRRDFWSCESGNSKMIADLVIYSNKKPFVLDTKWKILDEQIPSPEDLRQLFAYLHYYKAAKAALVYPGNRKELLGRYTKRSVDQKDEICSVLEISVETCISDWQDQIRKKLKIWIES